MGRGFKGRKPKAGHPWAGRNADRKPPTPVGLVGDGPKRRGRGRPMGSGVKVKGPALRKPVDIYGRPVRVRFSGTRRECEIIDGLAGGFGELVVIEFDIVPGGEG